MATTGLHTQGAIPATSDNVELSVIIEIPRADDGWRTRSILDRWVKVATIHPIRCLDKGTTIHRKWVR